MTINFAIRFEPDGYVTTGTKLMGRQAAGAGFLRAATQGRGNLPLNCYSPYRASFATFTELVRQLDPDVPTEWIPADRLDQLAALGTVYLPGPDIAEAARHRLRIRPLAYSIVGVTHTTASHGAMDMIADLVTAPVMPWDALVCTSSAVASTVRVILAHEQDYLERRFGKSLQAPAPQLPIIPLGVHCSDLMFHPGERQTARERLRISANEIVVLFVGRLSFHAKAHPHALYAALEDVARSAKNPITLLQAGWFANAMIESAFVDGAAKTAPSVRSLFTDGRNPSQLRQSWAAADIFVSLSDNVQETFGLTPIEAMAAGLPVVVTDWDGYRDTVRDGIDGFRIPTWMPPSGLGQHLAFRHELGVDSYDRYCGLSAQSISLDGSLLRAALGRLVNDRTLRVSLGAAGRARARQMYDWSTVFGQYQKLMAELEILRHAGSADPTCKQLESIRSSPRRLDPFLTFGGYASGHLTEETRVLRTPNLSHCDFKELQGTPLWKHTADGLPNEPTVEAILAVPEGSIEEIARQTGLSVSQVIAAVAPLAKMGLVRLASP